MASNSLLEFNRDTDLAAPTIRGAQAESAFALPEGAVIVSADTHYSLSDDIFYKGFPSRLKERAPRVWIENGVHVIGFDGESLLPADRTSGIGIFDMRAGSADLGARIADMDIEGVDKEIVFGNLIIPLIFTHPDLEIREWSVRVYNQHLAELQDRAPGRFYGVGFINHWDVAKTESSLRELKKLGLKTFMLPLNPGRDSKGNAIEYTSPGMRHFWDVIEEADLPVIHHIGETGSALGINSVAIAALQNFSPFRKMFGEYTMGGILDNHPRLKIAWIEAGINWVVSTIQDASLLYSSFRPALNYEMKRDIADYWRDQMFASFMYDPLGLELIDRIGADKAMWASDYPHAESTLGYGWTAMQKVIDAVPPDDARKILGGNAMGLFKL